jgi:hypothetical protein
VNIVMKNNPLFLWLTRKTRFPPMRSTLWLAFTLGIVILGISSIGVFSIPAADPTIPTVTIILFIPALLISLVTPPVIAAASAIMAARSQQGQAAELLRLTPLSQRDMAIGYVLAGLFRFRVWLALMIGLLPAFVIGILTISAFINAMMQPLVTCLTPELCPPPPPWNLSETMSGVFALTVLWWGSNFCGAALGVRLALWWKKSAAAALASLLLTVMIIIAPLALTSRTVFWPLSLLPWIAGISLVLGVGDS